MSEAIEYNVNPPQRDFRLKIINMGFDTDEYARSALSSAQADFYKKYGFKYGWNLGNSQYKYSDDFLYNFMLPNINEELEQINNFCKIMVDFWSDYDLEMARKWTCGNDKEPDYSISKPDVVKAALRRMIFEKGRNDFLINKTTEEVSV